MKNQDTHFIVTLLFVLFIAVGFLDVICYSMAKYPERTKHLAYKLPGGGIVALILLGKDKQN